jgi:hypothetical protein
MLGKKCTEAVELNLKKDKSILIEKGMSVAIPIYSIHRGKKKGKIKRICV